jgi:hypothetical protein
MHKLKIKKDHYIIAVGMSVGSIALIEIKLNEYNQIDAREIHRIQKVHDFGVNSLHLKICSLEGKI